VIEIQSQYAMRAYENFVNEASTLGEWYADVFRKATKPLEQAVAKKAA
jgi:hypothetical protein